MGQGQSLTLTGPQSPTMDLPQPPSPPLFDVKGKKSVIRCGSNVKDIIHDTCIDMRKVTMEIWKHRDDPSFISDLCEELSSSIDKKPVFDQVEFYLPQLAHMILHMDVELSISTMEQLVMLVSQSSVHFALQFFWIVYAALDEHRPKVNGDKQVFIRCAQLLLVLEQCLIYGSPAARQAEVLFAKHTISELEREKILMADRRFFAAQATSLAEPPNDGVAIEGWLLKKGGGTSRMGRRSWNQRWCRVERRILFVYSREYDIHARSAIQLDTIEINIIENPKHPHYFEVYQKFTDEKYKFAALNEEDMRKWTKELRKASRAPLPPSLSPKRVGPAKTFADMSESMRTFILQEDGQSSPVKGSSSTSTGFNTIDDAETKSHEENQDQPIPSQTESEESDAISKGKEEGEEEASNKKCVRRPSMSRNLLTHGEQLRYDFFSDERNFVKSITDICEEFRFMEPSLRKQSLASRLSALKIPSGAFIPMCKSTDTFCSVIGPCVNEGHVFNTHERVPILLYFEVVQDKYNRNVSTCLYESLYSGRNHAMDPPAEQPSTKTSNEALEEVSDFISLLLQSNETKERLKHVFGEIWHERKKRIRESSPHKNVPGWNLSCMIAKSNDDLRQEVFVMQLIAFYHNVYEAEELPLRLHPYRILSTGASTGLIELVKNATSLDGVKKSSGYTSLRDHFETIYGEPEGDLFQRAQKNFIESLDRHNGNILIDVEGHIVHIDFGFLLGRAPGGSFSIETAPFKLTMEMVDVMGGRDSDGFKYYVEMCTKAALIARKYAETVYTLVEIMSNGSTLPCFQGNVTSILSSLKERLFQDIPKEKVAHEVESLIDRAYNHFGTNQYDQFQVYSNGIAR